MLNFIVLGILPGTSLIITLTWVLITAIILIMTAVIWYEIRHAKHAGKTQKSSKIDFNKVSTS